MKLKQSQLSTLIKIASTSMLAVCSFSTFAHQSWHELENGFSELSTIVDLPSIAMKQMQFEVADRQGNRLIGALKYQGEKDRNLSSIALVDDKLVAQLHWKQATYTVTWRNDDYSVRSRVRPHLIEDNIVHYTQVQSRSRYFSPYYQSFIQADQSLPAPPIKRDTVHQIVVFDHSTVRYLTGDSEVTPENIAVARELLQADLVSAEQAFNDTDMQKGIKNRLIFADFDFPQESGTLETRDAVRAIPEVSRLIAINAIDVVQIITDNNLNSGWGGVAYSGLGYDEDNINRPDYFSDPPYFNLVKANAIGNGRVSAHETGHNLGANHDRHTLETGGWGAGGEHYFGAINYGYINSSESLYSIMAYYSSCRETAESYCETVVSFSNSKKLHGIDLGRAAGVEDSADMAAFLRIAEQDMIHQRYDMKPLSLSQNLDGYRVEWPDVSSRYEIYRSYDCDRLDFPDEYDYESGAVTVTENNYLDVTLDDSYRECVNVIGMYKIEGAEGVRKSVLGSVLVPIKQASNLVSEANNTYVPQANNAAIAQVGLSAPLRDDSKLYLVSSLAPCIEPDPNGYSCLRPSTVVNYDDLANETDYRQLDWLQNYFDISIEVQNDGVHLSATSKYSERELTQKLADDLAGRVIEKYGYERWLFHAKAIPVELLITEPSLSWYGEHYEKVVSKTTINFDIRHLLRKEPIFVNVDHVSLAPAEFEVVLGDINLFEGYRVEVAGKELNIKQSGDQAILDFSNFEAGNYVVTISNQDFSEKEIQVVKHASPIIVHSCEIGEERLCRIQLMGNQQLSSAVIEQSSGLNFDSERVDAKNNVIDLQASFSEDFEGETLNIAISYQTSELSDWYPLSFDIVLPKKIESKPGVGGGDSSSGGGAIGLEKLLGLGLVALIVVRIRHRRTLEKA
ncbi:M12 family metallo-peptidase [Vibrio maritimus]|uniref:M12 family metallo-peptidase n=1 Tax=Vibrio maritimus TaxID=990268 RepID=UPI004068D0F7